MLRKLIRDLMFHEHSCCDVKETLDKIEVIHDTEFAYPLMITPMLRKMHEEVYINHIKNALKDLRGHDLKSLINKVTSMYPHHPVSKAILIAYNGEDKESESSCVVM